MLIGAIDETVGDIMLRKHFLPIALPGTPAAANTADKAFLWLCGWMLETVTMKGVTEEFIFYIIIFSQKNELIGKIKLVKTFSAGNLNRTVPLSR